MHLIQSFMALRWAWLLQYYVDKYVRPLEIMRRVNSPPGIGSRRSVPLRWTPAVSGHKSWMTTTEEENIELWWTCRTLPCIWWNRLHLYRNGKKYKLRKWLDSLFHSLAQQHIHNSSAHHWRKLYQALVFAPQEYLNIHPRWCSVSGGIAVKWWIMNGYQRAKEAPQTCNLSSWDVENSHWSIVHCSSMKMPGFLCRGWPAIPYSYYD